MHTIRQILESFRFASKALKSNLLRTILSLLGVTVGIFAIISVLTFVDSLQQNIKDSFNFLGTNVIYMTQRPWGPPPDGGEYKWWEYFRRPKPSVNEFNFLQANMKHASAMSIYAGRGNLTLKHNSNSLGEVFLRGASDGYDRIFEIKIEQGRYFSSQEIASGSNVTVLGYEVTQKLFPGENPIGQFVKINNMKYVVIGTIAREGQSFLGFSSNDYSSIIPYSAFRKMYQTGTGRPDEIASIIGIKGYESDAGLVELENELRGFVRGRRGVKPIEKDNFSLNRPEAIVKSIEPVFAVMKTAGWFIGGFSMLIGGFGIANIMFVSVKERTSIIGLQKSLGAKNYFILFQFLFESVFLSLIGGLSGLFLVYLITFIPLGDLVVNLSISNIVLGLTVSSIIGLIAGIVPAAGAARLDPVVAIRAN